MALLKEKLDHYRGQLMSRRELMAKDLRLATEQLLNDETTFTDSVDQAAAETHKSLTVQMKNRDRQTLRQIDDALRRLSDGSFGNCVRCEEAISDARIDAFPFTTLCIECKAEIETEEHRFSGRV